MTRSTVSDPRLVKHVIGIADRRGIPYQIRQPGGGGTDAGSIAPTRGGVPTVSISVPARYIHTPVALINLNDVRHTIELVRESAARLTSTILRRA
jgi:endoglucanase